MTIRTIISCTIGAVLVAAAIWVATYDYLLFHTLAETCGAHLTKGRLVLVEGRLQIRTYITTAGEKRRMAEVVASAVEFLDRPPQGEDADFSGMGEEIPF